MNKLSTIDSFDIVVLAFYFILVLAAGLFAMFKTKRNSVKGYFLAGRYMTWLPVGASVFASNIGSEHFIGLAGSGASKGIAVGAFEFNAAILLQLLGWIFLPVYIASGVVTLPAYMKRRFGGNRIQLYLTILSLVLYIFTKISVNLYSGSIFVKSALGWNLYYSVLFILSMTAIITLTGGLAAVIYTDLVQCVVMLIGAVLLTSIGFYKIGGFSSLINEYGKSISAINASSSVGQSLITEMAIAVEKYNNVSITFETLASNSSLPTDIACSLPSQNAFVLLRGIFDSEMPWLGYLFGQTPASIWYWCADQMMVQRVLAAKSISHAQGATLMAGLIKLLPIFIMVIPGMISRVLYPDIVGCGTPEACEYVCQNRYGCSDIAYPTLVMGVMPTGLRGLMIAVMLAALMSDLTSIFNSASTLFTVDIYTRIRKQASNRELMIIGRLFIIVMVVLSVIWIPIIQSRQEGQLYIYIQSIAAYLSPPIAAVYLLAILIKRINEFGAFSGLTYGLAIGIIRMILDFVYTAPVCGEIDNRPWIVSNFHYMYFAMFSFFSSILVMIIFSLFKEPPSELQLKGTTFWTRKQNVHKSEALEVSENTFWDIKRNSIETSKNVEVGKLDNDNVVSERGDEAGNHTGFPNSDHSRGKNSNIARHVLYWICGLADTPCPDDTFGVDCCCVSYCNGTSDANEVDSQNSSYFNQEEMRAMQKELEIKQNNEADICYRSLKQKPRVRNALCAGVIGLFSITIFCYLFFTFYFGQISRGPILVINNSNSSIITEYVAYLLKQNVIRI